MKLEGEQVLLRVWLRSTDRHGWGSAADALVERARSDGLAGAILLRGVFGLDCAGQFIESGKFSLVQHLPIVVEVVDGAPMIGRFLTDVERIIPAGLATLERAHVLTYRHTQESANAARDRLQVPPSIEALSTLPSPQEFPMMKLSEEGQLVRVFIGESDTWHGQPLHRAIVLKAKELGLAGATVFHGTMGFGAHSRIHTAKLLELSTELPVLVEIVDSAEQIQRLLPFLDESVQEGLITIEAVRVLKYRANRTAD